MNARDAEAQLLMRCTRIARGESDAANDDREANVLRVASMLARTRHPIAARRLGDAADAYFARHPNTRQATDELIRQGWLISLPRFRTLLDERLNAR